MTRIQGIAIAVCALALSWNGIHAFFNGDDATNIVRHHGYWTKPISDLLMAAVSIATAEYRPVGGLFYRGMYALFGFDPLPFRIACFGLLVLNLFLAYRLVSRIDGETTATITLALIGYHAALMDLYWSTGTVYDLLCYCFVLSSMLFHLRGRERCGRRAWLEYAGAFCTFGLAVGAKETALVLPAVLLLMELLEFVPHGSSRRLGWGFIAACAAVAALALARKMGPQNAMTGNAAYEAHWAANHILALFRHYLGLLFYLGRPLPNIALAAAAAAALAAGIVLRRRSYWFGLGFFCATLLPVLVITPRSGYVMYLPLLGAGLSAATLVAKATGKVMLVAGRRSIALAMVMPSVVMGLLIPAHLRARPRFELGPRESSEAARRFFQALDQQRPRLAGAARILLKDDPFAPDDWILLFLSRLRYGDPRLWIDRTEVIGEPSLEDLTLYDEVWRFNELKLKVEENALKFSENLPLIRVAFDPEAVPPGAHYRISVAELAGRTIDVAYHLSARGRDVDAGVARNWCALSKSGSAELEAPREHPFATVTIDAIRQAGGAWRPATGSIRIVERQR